MIHEGTIQKLLELKLRAMAQGLREAMSAPPGEGLSFEEQLGLRLEETANGKLRYSLKKAWRDGTVALVLEPLDLLARVCALIPPPGPAIPCGQS